MKIPKIIKIIFSLVVFLILIKIIGLEKITTTLSQMKLIYLIPVITIYLLGFVIGTLNVFILLKGLKLKIRFNKLLKYTIISWSIGLFSPGKVGDFSIIYLLKKERIKPIVSFAVVLVDKIITLLVLLLFTLLTAIILLTRKEIILIFIIIILFLLVIYIIFNNKLLDFIKIGS